MSGTSTVFTTLLLAGGVLAGVLVAAAFFVLALSRHKRTIARGEVHLINCLASVEQPLEPEGVVLVRGEIWSARSRTGENIGCGRRNVRVVAARGAWLEVEACDRPLPAPYPSVPKM